MTKGPGSAEERIRLLRARLGISQSQLAERLGVSFATVNRWENGRTRPQGLAWRQLLSLEAQVAASGPGQISGATEARRQSGRAIEPQQSGKGSGRTFSLPEPSGPMDFAAPGEAVQAVVEAERLSHGYLTNPAFAAETALIDPLPHQRIAVYEHMLPQSRLRFLLADDAGAGKTIMTGLYIREMLVRGRLRRILIVPPAGLVGNWERELRTLFDLRFTIVLGQDGRGSNPFRAPEGDLVVVSIDTLSTPRMVAHLRAPDTEPYDLVVFDEAHKLSAERGASFQVRKTRRYRLAEGLVGATQDPRWRLPWHAYHVLLLTATPHMGKDYPYYALWRLLEPDALPTPEAFQSYPIEARRRSFLRRTKEEMVHLDGSPIFPQRHSSTLTFPLSEGERHLYRETTKYLRTYYRSAQMLNRPAAQLAMTVFQRRLASSTHALLRSLERRVEKLDHLIESIETGEISEEQLIAGQSKLRAEDPFEEMTADEEESAKGREANELAEDRILGGVVATSLADLYEERGRVAGLGDLARALVEKATESKFERLREAVADPQFRGQKVLIFTEFRDTLDFLVKRLEGLGYAGRVASIHGGMDFREREEQVAFFRRSEEEGGATYLVATDAAGEGINLQFCWLMVNYDIPWNPARLEQRLGRIHRYKQRHDPVLMVNLVAGETREGRVLKTLLDKLERIRKELTSDKVFDVIGRQLSGVSLRELLVQALIADQDDEAVRTVDALVSPTRIEAVLQEEERLFGAGGDVARELPAHRERIAAESYRHLIPGYVRRFLQRSASLVGLDLKGDLDGFFALRPATPGALNPLAAALERYSPEARSHLTVYRPPEGADAVFLRPGEPLFDRYAALVRERLGPLGRRGGILVDPNADKPYFIHVAALHVVREADPDFPEALPKATTLSVQLVALRQEPDGEVTLVPVEHLLLLHPASRPVKADPAMAWRGTVSAEQVEAYLRERFVPAWVEDQRARLREGQEERVALLAKGFDYQAAELARRRAALSPRAREGDPQAIRELEGVKEAQRKLGERRRRSLALQKREAELVRLGEFHFIAHALVIPSDDPEERMRHDREIEQVAVRIAWGYEESRGSTVRDVSLPHLAVAAGLKENPGFDLLSRLPSGEARAIEVKGRARVGDVQLSENEWAQACNLRGRYWLYVVYDCASPHPRLLRVRDPFGKLLARERGGVIIGQEEIFRAAEEGEGDDESRDARAPGER